MTTTIISAFVTNLNAYNAGSLIGEWVTFPITKETFEEVKQHIEAKDNNVELFNSDYDSSYINYLYRYLGEYANPSELNYLASLLEELSDDELEKLDVVCYLENPRSAAEVINIVNNLECYEYLPDVANEEDLGYYYIHESGIYTAEDLGVFANYIDYSAYGRDVAIDEGGTFTENGYIVQTDSINNDYTGFDDIPEEYRL